MGLLITSFVIIWYRRQCTLRFLCLQYLENEKICSKIYVSPRITILCKNTLPSLVFLESAAIPETTQDHLQIFNIELKSKVKTHQMPEQVCLDFPSSYENPSTNANIWPIMSKSALTKNGEQNPVKQTEITINLHICGYYFTTFWSMYNVIFLRSYSGNGSPQIRSDLWLRQQFTIGS